MHMYMQYSNSLQFYVIPLVVHSYVILLTYLANMICN